MVDMIGKMWFDRSMGKDIPLPVCVERAAASYRRAFQREPDVCYINPRTREEPPDEVDGIRIALLDNILLHHYWVGREGNGSAPEPVEDHTFTTCPDPKCGAEQLLVTSVCWACGYEV